MTDSEILDELQAAWERYCRLINSTSDTDVIGATTDTLIFLAAVKSLLARRVRNLL